MKKYLVAIMAMALLLPLLIVSGLAKNETKKEKSKPTINPADLFVQKRQPVQRQEKSVTPVASKAVGFAISPALRDLPDPSRQRNTSIYSPGEEDVREINEENTTPVRRAINGAGLDPLVQTNLLQQRGTNTPAVAMPTPILTFEGMSSQDNLNASGGSTVMPPDTNGDVGPNHYVETTNFLFQAYNKTGTPLLAGGRMYKQLFGALGGVCSTRNDGDPVVLYDQLADRWMISQFCTAQDPFSHQLVAYSTTGDPTGTYYLYDFQMPDTHFPDYPKFGIWHDGLYMTANVFGNVAGTFYYGAGTYVLDRKRMLVGDSAAQMIYMDVNQIEAGLFGQIPTDLEGYQAPPSTLPELICEWRSTVFGDPIDALRCYEFRPNFETPSLTTLTVLPDLATAAFDPRDPGPRTDIEQPSPATSAHNLDSLSDRNMARLVYRNQGNSASPVNNYVTNWTVNVSGVTPTTGATYQAGIRWAEFRRAGGGAFSMRDQGTYVNGAISGATGENDWMASMTTDNQGNLALGYSASSTTLLPTIKWAGRTGAPSGTLDQGEAVMFSSTGVQQATNSRWGDYTSLNVDPVDDCTFWHANEYRLLANQGASGTPPFLWNTRIGNFKFAGCTTSPRGSISGSVTFNGNPVANAVVTTSNGFFVLTDGSGNYSMPTVGPDTYSMTAFKSGLGVSPATAAGVVVTNGNNTVQNFVFSAAADVSLGTVTITEGPFSNGNGTVDPGETGNIVVQLNDPSAVAATAVTATLSVKEPLAGVKVAQPNARSLGTIAGNSSTTNGGNPYRFTLAATTPVGTTITFLLKVDFGGGQSPELLSFTTTVGVLNAFTSTIPSTTLDATPPSVPVGGISATTGTNQTGRVVRTGVASGCGALKANPGLNDATPGRSYDSYVFQNPTTNTWCVTVTVNQSSTLLYAVVYNNGGFVPANPSTNFLGDPGSSAATMTWSFDVAPLSNFTLVVHEVTVGTGVGQAYNATISAVSYLSPPVRRRADFDIDLKSDISVFRPSEGNWYSRNSSNGVTQVTNWGVSTDKAVPGDYDGDGKTDYAVFRPSEGNWYILNSFDGTYTIRNWGNSTDVPISGDFDGDGKNDVTVFRPSEGKWYTINSYNGLTQANAWGNGTDKLVPGDYDGDGKTDLAVYRPSEGNWYIRKSSGGITVQGWGVSTDLVVPADYDGDRKADFAIYRPSEGNWYIIKSTGGITIQNWGNSTDLPVPADYDGDGKTDIAVFRLSDTNWYIIKSGGGVTVQQFGVPTDRPVPYDYIPQP